MLINSRSPNLTLSSHLIKYNHYNYKMDYEYDKNADNTYFTECFNAAS